MQNETVRDVIIVGGGVTGTALAKILSEYTNVESIALIEKAGTVGTINSHPLNNAQTSHDGSTETNYNLDHALEVRWASELLRHYALSKDDSTLFKITNRMALGVGDDEVQKLMKRYVDFKGHYPDLRLVGVRELTRIEPKIMEGRDPKQRIVAMVSDQGFAINYQRLSEYMLEDAKQSNKSFDCYFNTWVGEVDFKNEVYTLQTSRGPMRTRVLIFAAGAYSLKFAQELGYGLNYTIFPVAGSFVTTPKVLNGKVYPMQIEGMPFAAIHGDPDILDPTITRFGPTTKPLPLMERHHYNTMADYFRTGILSWAGLRSTAQVLWERNLIPYVIRNELYDMPFIGMRLFLNEVQKIVPTLRYEDLTLRRGAGGIRPQLVNMTTGQLEMGDSCIIGDKVIFNTTPSPGASICLGNAVRDTEQIMKFLGEGYRFRRDELMSDLNVADQELKHKVMYSA